MFTTRQEPSRPAVTRDEGRRQSLRRLDEVAGVVEAVAAEMAAAGYPKKDAFAARLALEEALVNAVKHGNQGDPSKQVQVRYDLSEERLLVDVEDEGCGFDPAEVPDPLAPENLERSCGRGLHLIRSYMTWVRHNERGNRVTLCRHRTR
jgi:serine/threonine-protein kinase RsbW